MEECYPILAGRKVVLLQFLELGTLCTVLGWGISVTSMPAISLLCTGMIMSKSSSKGDKLWGQYLEKIAPSLQVYALGVCLLGRTAEHSYISWLLCFLKELLTSLEVSQLPEVPPSGQTGRH